MFGSILCALLISIVSHRWSRVDACSVSTSSSWPVDCSQRGYFIVLDSQNATILTSTLYNTVYNPKTSNTTTWTSARRMAFNSYNNTVQNVTVDNTIYPTMTSKLNKIVSTFTSYCSNDCNWQAYFYSTPLLLGGCQWGSIGDFVACGNATTNYTLPITSSPPSCGSSTTSMAASTPTSKVSSTSTATTPSSASTGSTSTSSSSTSTSQSTTTTFISSSNSSSNSSASCKLITSSNWPVDCSQRGYLISLDSTSNATMFTTIVYNTVYNVSSSNQTVWTFARRSSFNSYWNSMHNILWNTTTTISERMNSLVYLLSNYSTNDCTWQAQFFATSLTMADGCTWGSIGDFLACGSASSNYSLPVTTASPSSCAFGSGGSGGGGVTVGGGGEVTVSGGGNGGSNATVNGQTITVNGQTVTVNGVTVTGQMATATESANTGTVKNITMSGMTGSSNVSLFTILSNVSAVTESSLNLTLGMDNSTAGTETMPTASSSTMTTECVTIAYYTITVNGTTLSIPMSSMASSTSTGSTTMSTSMGTQTSTDSSTASSTSMSTSEGSSSSMASAQSTTDSLSSTDMSSTFSSTMSSITASSTSGSSSSNTSNGSTDTTGASTFSGSTAGTASTPSIVYVTVCGNTTTTP